MMFLTQMLLMVVQKCSQSLMWSLILMQILLITFCHIYWWNNVWKSLSIWQIYLFDVFPLDKENWHLEIHFNNLRLNLIFFHKNVQLFKNYNARDMDQ